MPSILSSRLATVALLACSTLVLSFPTAARAQACGCRAGIEDFGYRFHHHDRPASAVPEGVGQSALGAIQEVVGLLLGDARTDWSRVSIERLRRHLVDLDRIVLDAEVEQRPVDGGLTVQIRGTERTLEAARRVIPAHAHAMQGFRGWSVAVEESEDAVHLTLSTADPDEVAVLRGMGFFGFVASGVHRPHQLLSIARGVEDPGQSSDGR